MAQYGSAQSANEYARAYHRPGQGGRFLRARLRLVEGVLANCPGGSLLDAGCGPGAMAHALLTSRPDDFRISVMDQSFAMIEYCAASVCSVGTVYPVVGQLEALPYADNTFDVTLVMGVLEYANILSAISEISRVTRPGGLVVVTMLNPLSPYRIAEWILYWPLLRAVGAIERYLSIPVERRHGARATGIRAFTAGKLQRLMVQANLKPIDLIYYNAPPLIPPFDRLSSYAHKAGRAGRGRAATASYAAGWAPGYLLVARRS